MIFLCFSVKDRIPLINDFYHYLLNFGLEVWYDRRNIFLGDPRYETNIRKGAANPNIRYAIVLYSKQFPTGNICLEEFRILMDRYKKGNLTIFPIFLDGVPHTMTEGLNLCKELVYKEMTGYDSFWPIALHIMAKVTHDELLDRSYKSIKDVIEAEDVDKTCAYYLLTEYENIEKCNYAMRIAMLFSIYIVLTANRPRHYMHYKIANYLYHQSCIGVIIEEKRELQVMENIVVYEFGSLL